MLEKEFYKKKTSNRATLLIGFALILFLFYYIYRYVLQMNDSGTSPTYADTTFFWKAAKYFILLAILIFCFFDLITENIGKKHITIFAFFISFFIFQNLYAFLYNQSSDFVVVILCLLLSLYLIFTKGMVSLNIIDKIFSFFMHFTIIYEVIQIILYFAIGRLPALGYDTGVITDVRFGGAWDAPNEFSILIAFYIPYVYFKYKGIKRAIYFVLLFAMLLLTWSLTGIAAVLGLCIFAALISLYSKTRNIFAPILLIVYCLAVIGLIFVFNVGHIEEFLLGKLGSINDHLNGWDLSGLSALNFLGIIPDMEFSETSFVLLLRRGGFLQVIVFYAIGIASVFWSGLVAKSIDDAKARRIFRSMQWYQIAFLLASLNLPFVYSFSNLGIFAIFLGIIYRYYSAVFPQKKSLRNETCLLKAPKNIIT